jgi:hypothetical protein
MGRPWITVAFDIATRVVLGFALHRSAHHRQRASNELKAFCAMSFRGINPPSIDSDHSGFDFVYLSNRHSAAGFDSR